MEESVTRPLLMLGGIHCLQGSYGGGGGGGSGGGGGRQFTAQRGQQASSQQQLPPVRSLPSPGTPGGPRQSSYPPESFPPPASPTAGNYQASGQFPQQLRLQRTISAPSATTQLPGNTCNP